MCTYYYRTFLNKDLNMKPNMIQPFHWNFFMLSLLWVIGFIVSYFREPKISYKLKIWSRIIIIVEPFSLWWFLPIFVQELPPDFELYKPQCYFNFRYLNYSRQKSRILKFYLRLKLRQISAFEAKINSLIFRQKWPKYDLVGFKGGAKMIHSLIMFQSWPCSYKYTRLNNQ